MLKPMEPLEAIPITHGVSMVKVDPNAKYIVFMDASIVTDKFVTEFCMDTNNPLPSGTPVFVIEDVDRAVRIYEILDTKVVTKAADNGR